jgi:electron transfer flavoprotein beta subunit
MLSVLVCYKVTYDVDNLTRKELRAICDGTGDLAYTKRTIGGYNEAALETALTLRDAALAGEFDISLTALTVGNEESCFASDLYAIGYDEVVHVVTEEDLTYRPEKTAGVICSYILRSGAFDIILTGQQAGLGESSQVPYIIAEELGLPCISNVTDMELSGGVIRVTKKTDAGTSRYNIKAPAVYAMGNAVHPFLRLATLRSKLAAASKKENVIPAGDCPTHMGEAQLQRLVYEEPERQCAFVEGKTLEDKIDTVWDRYIKGVTYDNRRNRHYSSR